MEQAPCWRNGATRDLIHVKVTQKNSDKYGIERYVNLAHIRCPMSAQEKIEKKLDFIISQLFQIAIDLNENQQQKLLDYAEKLLVEEKRENIRRSCNIPVHYAANDHVYANQIINISANGLFIETGRPLKRGEEVIMAFNLKGFDKSLKLKGEIARASQAGIGVEFKNISPHIEEMIRVIVNRMK